MDLRVFTAIILFIILIYLVFSVDFLVFSDFQTSSFLGTHLFIMNVICVFFLKEKKTKQIIIKWTP